MGGDDEREGTGLELDLSRRSGGVAAPAGPAGSVEPAGPVSGAPRSLGRFAPAYAPEPVVDRLEARMLARYPKVPSRLWELPGYARDAKARLAEIQVLTAARERDHAAAKAQLDEALVEIARRAVTLSQGLSRLARQPYQPTLDSIASSEAELRSVDGARMSEVDAINQKVAALDRRVDTARHELEAAKQAQRRAAAGAGPKALEEGRKMVADAEGVVTLIVDERAKLADAAVGRAVARNPAADAARKEFNAVCADFAQFVMDDEVNFGAAFAPARAKIAALREAAAKASKNVALHHAAAALYDREGVAKAKSVLTGGIVGAAVLLLLVVYLIVR